MLPGDAPGGCARSAGMSLNILGDLALVEARKREHEKYGRAYEIETYRMGGRRWHDAVRNLADLPCRGSYLDVGCGRGEMLIQAIQLGFLPVIGTEVVRYLTDGDRVRYAEAHAL